MKQELITINEAARRKGVTRQAIHQAINDGRLLVTKVATVKLMLTAEALELFKPSATMQARGRRPKRITIDNSPAST